MKKLLTLTAAAIITLAAAPGAQAQAPGAPKITTEDLARWVDAITSILRAPRGSHGDFTNHFQNRIDAITGPRVTYYRPGWHHEHHPNRGKAAKYSIMEKDPWRRRGTAKAVFINPTPKGE